MIQPNYEVTQKLIIKSYAHKTVVFLYPNAKNGILVFPVASSRLKVLSFHRDRTFFKLHKGVFNGTCHLRFHTIAFYSEIVIKNSLQKFDNVFLLARFVKLIIGSVWEHHIRGSFSVFTIRFVLYSHVVNKGIEFINLPSIFKDISVLYLLVVGSPHHEKNF